MNKNLEAQMKKLNINDRHNNSFLTRKTFNSSMRNFLEFASDRKLQKIENISDKQIKAYINEKIDNGCENIYLRKIMSAIRYYNKMECDLKGVESRITITNKELGIMEKTLDFKRGITDDEFKIAKEVCKDENFKDCMDLALHVGLRSNEIFNLRMSTLKDAINKNNGTIEITDGTKGGKERLAIIDDDGMEIIKNIYDKNIDFKYIGDKVFSSNEKNSVKEEKSRWHSFFNRYSNQILERSNSKNTDEPITAHCLRRQYARNLFQSEMNKGTSKKDACDIVSEALGHGKGRKDITALYLGFKI